MNARQLAADDTRRRLYAAAVTLFSAGGYHATTVDAIAKSAGVAKGTFFVHFATKDAVLIDLVRKQVEIARQARQAALAHGPFVALRTTILTLGAEAGRSRELSRAVLAATTESAAVAQEADALFALVLAELEADARAARLVDSATLARGLMAAYLGACLHFTTSRTSAGLSELLVPLVDALLRPGVAVHAPAPHAPAHARS